MSRSTCTMGRSACVRRRPTWRSAPPTRSSTSSLSLICPRTRAWETPAWSCCWWTQTQATHAAPTPSSGAWCLARLQRAPLASTGGRSATTHVARLPSGTACQRIRTSSCWQFLLSIFDLVQPLEGWNEDGRDLPSREPVPIGLQWGCVGNKGEGTLMLRGGHLKWCHHSINHSITYLWSYWGSAGRVGRDKGNPIALNDPKDCHRKSPGNMQHHLHGNNQLSL